MNIKMVLYYDIQNKKMIKTGKCKSVYIYINKYIYTC